MKIASIAALVAVSLALSACDRDEIDRVQSILAGDDPYGPGSETVAEIIKAEARYVTLDPSGGPMGEEIATGPDCQPVFRLRICK